MIRTEVKTREPIRTEVKMSEPIRTEVKKQSRSKCCFVTADRVSIAGLSLDDHRLNSATTKGCFYTTVSIEIC